MSHFWTKEGLFGQKRRVLGQKCRVLGQKGGFLDKSRIFGQDKFTDGQPSGFFLTLVNKTQAKFHKTQANFWPKTQEIS